MSILLLGARGQLGRALGEVLPHDTLKWGRHELDLSGATDITSTITAIHPDIIVNAAAMTDVDACETKVNLAEEINEKAPGVLGKVCMQLGAVLVHISTDYVFGADEMRNTPYGESDTPGPVNVYGKTKWHGEQNVMASGCDYLIVRTCGLYGGRGERPQYVERVISTARSGKAISATVDQVYSPTFVGELAPALWRLIQEHQRGVAHVVNTGPVTRFAFTEAVLALCGLAVPVREAKRDDFAGAKRPGYSALDSERLTLNAYMSDWRTALSRYLATL